MSLTDSGVPVEFNNETIVDAYELTFDPGDAMNGSLYLCTVRGSAAIDPSTMLAPMRAANLWSTEKAKQVADDQRQTYKDGLEFVEAIAYCVDADHIVIARFDHPKFPSDSGRWQAWVDFFDGRYERVE